MSVIPAKPSVARKLRQEVLGFASVGAAGFAVDAGLTMLLVKFGGLTPFAARIPSTLIAIGVTFLFNRHWTFKSQDDRRWREFFRYLGVNLSGAMLSYACYAMFLLACSYLALIDAASSAAIFMAIVTGAVAAAFFNFLGARYIAFIKRASAPHNLS